MNSKGQLIITELILYIIIIVICISMILYIFNTINNNQVMTLDNRMTNQILEDTMDTLIMSEGTPSNWDNLSDKDIKTIGLRKNSLSYQISYNKLSKLKNNTDLIDDFFPKGLSYSLIVYPKNNPKNQEYIAGEYSLENRNNIYSREVPIIIDYGYDIYTIKSHKYMNYCPYNHNNSSSIWQCKPFSINRTSIYNGIFYIVSNNETNYILSNTYNQQVNNTVSNKKNINQEVETLLNSENDTIYIHINTNTTSYLVYDENNLEKYLDSIYDPEIYILKLSISN